MAGRKGFMMYTEWWRAMSVLSGEELRRLLQAMVDYTESGSEPQFTDRLLYSQWEMIRTRMERDAQRYEQTKRARQEAVNKRWEKAAQETQSQPPKEQRNYPAATKTGNGYAKTRQQMDDGMDQYLNW